MSWYHFLYDNKLYILYSLLTVPEESNEKIVAKVYNSLKFDKDNKLENIFPIYNCKCFVAGFSKDVKMSSLNLTLFEHVSAFIM